MGKPSFVYTRLVPSSWFLVSDCRFGVSPVNYPDPDLLYIT